MKRAHRELVPTEVSEYRVQALYSDTGTCVHISAHGQRESYSVTCAREASVKFISISSLYLLLQMKLQNKGYEEAHEKPQGF